MSEQQADYKTRSKTIFRVEKNADNPFVMIDRRPIENPKLSWKAKGILAYLLSRPDNWIVRLGDLVKRSPDGAFAVRGAIKELRDVGHISYQIDRENGHIKQWLLVVHEIPLLRDNQQVGKQQVENLPLNDTDSLTDTDSKDIGADAPKVPASFGIDWQVAAGNEDIVIPEGSDFDNSARSWSALIAMNNADLESLAFEFMTSAHKLPIDDDIKFWRKAFRKFKKHGATSDVIHQAIVKHGSLAIKSPASIEWAVIEVINPTPNGEIAAPREVPAEILARLRAQMDAELGVR